jgi:hypothetical protein
VRDIFAQLDKISRDWAEFSMKVAGLRAGWDLAKNLLWKEGNVG